MRIGVCLTGGGARGSYQAGVLLALAELLKKHHLEGERNPLYYWSGTSAGAINQAYCVAGIDNLVDSAYKLTQIWSNLKAERIYKTDLLSVGKNGARWLKDLTLGPLMSHKSAKYLLDTAPLYELLSRGLFYSKIRTHIDNDLVFGLATTSYNYSEGRSCSFLQTRNPIAWNKPRRYSVNATLTAKHVLASCAIPILFPSVNLGGQYYGDGGFRCTSPISPIIHMGAKKILFIGVRGPNEIQAQTSLDEPAIAKISGNILNALFFDTIDLDLERIQHINEIVDVARGGEVRTERSDYSKVEVKMIRPSQDLSVIANERGRVHLPKTVDYLLSGLGSKADTAELASYILFEKPFTSELVDLGYRDFQASADSVSEWLLA
jgi:NTE family protein